MIKEVTESDVMKVLSKPHVKIYRDTGMIPTAAAETLFPFFCKGYFTKLIHRKKLDGMEIGGQFYVNMTQAREYTRPRMSYRDGGPGKTLPTNEELGL